jgi:hypothetical protein
MLDLAIRCNLRLEFLSGQNLGKQVKNHFIYDFFSFKDETSSASYIYILANSGRGLSEQGLAETNVKANLYFQHKAVKFWSLMQLHF